MFADDLSMGGAAAAFGDIVTRATRALSAGCDMLPVCNQRASVVELLDRLHVEPEPASGLRLVRLHGRGGLRPGGAREPAGSGSAPRSGSSDARRLRR